MYFDFDLSALAQLLRAAIKGTRSKQYSTNQVIRGAPPSSHLSSSAFSGWLANACCESCARHLHDSGLVARDVYRALRFMTVAS
jgi:hypothetical protein